MNTKLYVTHPDESLYPVKEFGQKAHIKNEYTIRIVGMLELESQIWYFVLNYFL